MNVVIHKEADEPAQSVRTVIEVFRARNDRIVLGVDEELGDIIIINRSGYSGSRRHPLLLGGVVVEPAFWPPERGTCGWAPVTFRRRLGTCRRGGQLEWSGEC